MSRKYDHEVTLRRRRAFVVVEHYRRDLRHQENDMFMFWCIILQEMHLAKSKDETNSHGYQRCRALLTGPSFPLRVTKRLTFLKLIWWLISSSNFAGISPNQRNSQESQKSPGPRNRVPIHRTASATPCCAASSSTAAGPRSASCAASSPQPVMVGTPCMAPPCSWRSTHRRCAKHGVSIFLFFFQVSIAQKQVIKI